MLSKCVQCKHSIIGHVEKSNNEYHLIPCFIGKCGCKKLEVIEDNLIHEVWNYKSNTPYRTLKNKPVEIEDLKY